MANVPAAKQSPRVEDGVIKWYQGDTFKIKFIVTIKDKETQEVIPLQNGDVITITFVNHGTHIKVYSFTEFEDNSFELFVNDTDTLLFKKGTYRYKITHFRDYNRTIVDDNLCVVE